MTLSGSSARSTRILRCSLWWTAAAWLAVACVPQPHVIVISAVPSDANHTLDGEPLAGSEVKLAPHDGREHLLKTCREAGYFCVDTVLSTASASTVRVELPVDESWNATVPCEQVNSVVEFTREGLPEEVMASLESRLMNTFAALEVRDQHFLRTQWKLAGKEGDPRRFQSRAEVTLVEVDGQTITLSLKVESESVTDDGRIAPIARTFPELAALLDSLAARP